MHFNDRISLGKRFARELEKYDGKDAVILCLKESSLLSCLTMAMELRAWVYPLITTKIVSEDLSGRTLGLINQDGVFCSASNETETSSEVSRAIHNQKTAAMQQIQQQYAKYEMPFNKMQMNGRHVIIACDVLTDELPLLAANKLIQSLKPKSTSAIIGNATPEVAEVIRISADKTLILDVISGVVKDDARYFNHRDEYMQESKYQVTKHIATYWQ